jgi:hypothetical protein
MRVILGQKELEVLKIKKIVFGVLKRPDKVYLKVINNTSRKKFLPIIKGEFAWIILIKIIKKIIFIFFFAK